MRPFESTLHIISVSVSISALLHLIQNFPPRLRASAPLSISPSLWPVRYAQTAALLEIAHAAVGLVRAPVALTAVQVFSRVNVVWGILAMVPGARTAEVPLLQ